MAGTWINPRASERPFADVLEAWQESWDGRLSPTTARRYQSICDKYLTPEFGRQRTGSLSHEVVRRYVTRLAADPALAPGTVRNVYAVLRTACAKGVRMGMLRTNPCASIDLPRARREEMLFLTAEEVRAVADGIDPAYKVLIYTAAYTGLRAGELAGLQRQDVDLLRGVRALKDVNGYLQLGPTKTHAQRTVALPAFLKGMLREHRAQSPGVPSSYVFTMKGGGPLRMGLVYGRYFKRSVRGWTDKRGRTHPGALPERLHRLRFHDLRHSCAALSVAAGGHPKLIQERLGHASITTTLDTYGHLFASLEQSLAEALDAAFRAPAPEETTNVVELHG